MTSANIHISSHDTPQVLFDALARVFPPSSHDESRWVTVNVDDVTLTFFAPPHTTMPPATEELTDADYERAESIA